LVPAPDLRHGGMKAERAKINNKFGFLQKTSPVFLPRGERSRKPMPCQPAVQAVVSSVRRKKRKNLRKFRANVSFGLFAAAGRRATLPLRNVQ
jgi:hypothetical protein